MILDLMVVVITIIVTVTATFEICVYTGALSFCCLEMYTKPFVAILHVRDEIRWDGTGNKRLLKVHKSGWH